MKITFDTVNKNTFFQFLLGIIFRKDQKLALFPHSQFFPLFPPKYGGIDSRAAGKIIQFSPQRARGGVYFFYSRAARVVSGSPPCTIYSVLEPRKKKEKGGKCRRVKRLRNWGRRASDFFFFFSSARSNFG